jgi:DNA-binding NtrC family response regulator
LFLDEITEMPQELQVKLLRVLETGRFMRVGSTQSQEADVRVIAATNRDPLQAVAAGKLREDLMYRLNVFPIHLPSLRERMEDVPLLATHFLAGIGAQEGRAKTFSKAALERLGQWRWPGNVRELRNAVQRAYVMAPGDQIDDTWLPAAAAQTAASPLPGAVPGAAARNENRVTFAIGTSMAQVERAMILATLEHYQHHRERTAAVLGISLKTLYNRLKEYSSGTDDGPSAAQVARSEGEERSAPA